MDVRPKKEEKVEEGETDVGDAWIYTCLRRESYFFLGFSVGRWTQETCNGMIDRVTDTLEQYGTVTFYSDGNDDYTYVLPRYFDDLDYGQLVKIREKGTVIGKEKRRVYGDPDLYRVETFNVENFNSILRNRLARLIRKTKNFSKIKTKLHDAFALFQFYRNFMHQLKTKNTPAMNEKITNHKWTWHEYLNYHYAT